MAFTFKLVQVDGTPSEPPPIALAASTGGSPVTPGEGDPARAPRVSPWR